MLHCALHYPPIPEAHLGLHRMHIDVDKVRRDHDIETECGTRTRRDRRAIRLLSRAHEAVIANGASVHGEEDAPPRGAHVGGTLDEPRNVNRAVYVIDVHESL